ncbi:MAG: hypothetical protein ACK559_18500, partial [bacterium]
MHGHIAGIQAHRERAWQRRLPCRRTGCRGRCKHLAVDRTWRRTSGDQATANLACEGAWAADEDFGVGQRQLVQRAGIDAPGAHAIGKHGSGCACLAQE